MEILQEIKDAEKKSEEIIAKAQKDKEKILQEAKHKSIIFVEKEQARIDSEKEEKVRSGRESAEITGKEIISKGEQEAKKLKQKSEKNIEKAVDSVIEIFEQMV